VDPYTPITKPKIVAHQKTNSGSKGATSGEESESLAALKAKSKEML